MHDDGVGEGGGGEFEVLRRRVFLYGCWRSECRKGERGNLERVDIVEEGVFAELRTVEGRSGRVIQDKGGN